MIENPGSAPKTGVSCAPGTFCQVKVRLLDDFEMLSGCKLVGRQRAGDEKKVSCKNKEAKKVRVPNGVTFLQFITPPTGFIRIFPDIIISASW